MIDERDKPVVENRWAVLGVIGIDRRLREYR